MNATGPRGLSDMIARLRDEGGEELVQGLARPLAENERPEQRVLELGLISDRDMALEIAMKSGRPFSSLRGAEPDRRLLLYLPLELAERELVLPLILIGDTLTVASAFLDPDLSLIEERFPKVQIELVIAPYHELMDCLRQLRGES